MGDLAARPRGDGRQPKVTIGVVLGAKAPMNDISAAEVLIGKGICSLTDSAWKIKDDQSAAGHPCYSGRVA